MNKLTLALSLTCAALVGCVASTFIVPQVRAGTNPTRWEYTCIKGKQMPEYANKLGAGGCELAAAAGGYGHQFCFKRAMP